MTDGGSSEFLPSGTWRFIKYLDGLASKLKSLGVSWTSWCQFIRIFYESPSTRVGQVRC